MEYEYGDGFGETAPGSSSVFPDEDSDDDIKLGSDDSDSLDGWQEFGVLLSSDGVHITT